MRIHKFFKSISYRCAIFYGRYNQKWLANFFYKSVFDRNVNWEKPKEFNEKIKWMQFMTDTSLWTLCSDKYRVRQYIESKGYKELLVKLYGVWDNPDDIDFDKLPNKFVLKTNHGCGDVFIIEDKSKADLIKIRKDLNRYLKHSYGYETAEPHYTKMRPCIIAEELLENTSSFSNTIVDYKFYVFSGTPVNCGVYYNRNEETHTTYSSFYDMDWRKHPEWQNPNKKTESGDVPRPINLAYMIQLCHDLAGDFPFVRLDLYECNNKVYFGEFTFTPAGANGGSLNPSLFEHYGELIDLSKCKVL